MDFRISDHATLSLIQTATIKNRHKPLKKPFIQKIFCDLVSMTIPLEKCNSCDKCNRYFELIKFLTK